MASGCRQHGLSHADPWDCEIHDLKVENTRLRVALERIYYKVPAGQATPFEAEILQLANAALKPASPKEGS